MPDNKVIIVTGAAGFIGSCIVEYLNVKGHNRLVLVDKFNQDAKQPNWEHKQYLEKVDRDELFSWLKQFSGSVEAIIHMGARTDTLEFDYAVHQKLNVDYTQALWTYCANNDVPLIYASSAATYGDGELGYSDNHDVVSQLKPLNPYGISKNEFDKWALDQELQPSRWAGLKFFNIYGPNEYHKGKMASVIWHSFNQINKEGEVKLFRSHNPNYKDGEQLRDFVYVKDLLKVIFWMMSEMMEQHWPKNKNGLYNLGTGQARSFYDLAKATFSGLDKVPNILFIDMPEHLRDKYQYFTEADMAKLKAAGYTDEFYSLEQGVDDYVRNYLAPGKFY